jgi:hypothetical protein
VNNRLDLITEYIAPGTVGAEIGVLHGDFSEQLLRAKPRLLYLVDAWQSYRAYGNEPSVNREDMEAIHRGCVARFCGNEAVRILRGFSVTVSLCEEIEPLDWVYLDANHARDFVFLDLVAWSLRLKPGGFLAGHDYNCRPAENFGVIEAVEEFCRRFGWHVADVTPTSDPVRSYLLRRNP